MRLPSQQESQQGFPWTEGTSQDDFTDLRLGSDPRHVPRMRSNSKYREQRGPPMGRDPTVDKELEHSLSHADHGEAVNHTDSFW